MQGYLGNKSDNTNNSPDHYYYLQTVDSLHYKEIPMRCNVPIST